MGFYTLLDLRNALCVIASTELIPPPLGHILLRPGCRRDGDLPLLQGHVPPQVRGNLPDGLRRGLGLTGKGPNAQDNQQ